MKEQFKEDAKVAAAILCCLFFIPTLVVVLIIWLKFLWGFIR